MSAESLLSRSREPGKLFAYCLAIVIAATVIIVAPLTADAQTIKMNFHKGHQANFTVSNSGGVNFRYFAPVPAAISLTRWGPRGGQVVYAGRPQAAMNLTEGRYSLKCTSTTEAGNPWHNVEIIGAVSY
jgi:hypothetical protein